jgi:putative two-component system response regulator
LPGLDGFAVCRHLKADPRTDAIPVIFITSLQNRGDEAQGFKAGRVEP